MRLIVGYFALVTLFLAVLGFVGSQQAEAAADSGRDGEQVTEHAGTAQPLTVKTTSMGRA